MIGDDLFPRDFIYSLAPPTNYIGADKIFGDTTEEFSDVLIPLRREEMDLFFPFTHKKTLEVDNMAIFYAQTDNPVLSVDVIPIGRVTSDLSVFENLDSREEVIFSLAE